MLADLHFTEFGHFQKLMPFLCFTDRILTNAFMFAQTPCQRADETLIPGVSLFLRTLSASAVKMGMRCINAFDGLYLYILWMLGIV